MSSDTQLPVYNRCPALARIWNMYSVKHGSGENQGTTSYVDVGTGEEERGNGKGDLAIFHLQGSRGLFSIRPSCFGPTSTRIHVTVQSRQSPWGHTLEVDDRGDVSVPTMHGMLVSNSPAQKFSSIEAV